jgi:hypothetical protein
MIHEEQHLQEERHREIADCTLYYMTYLLMVTLVQVAWFLQCKISNLFCEINICR